MGFSQHRSLGDPILPQGQDAADDRHGEQAHKQGERVGTSPRPAGQVHRQGGRALRQVGRVEKPGPKLPVATCTSHTPRPTGTSC